MKTVNHSSLPPEVEAALQHFQISAVQLQNVVGKALETGGDYCDLFFEHTKNNSISLLDRQVDRCSSNIDYGVGIRVLKGEQTGYAYVENTLLPDMLRAARTAARIADCPATMTPAAISAPVFANYYPIENDWGDIAVSAKKAFLERLNSLVFELDPSVIKVSISLSDSASDILFFNSEGLLCADRRPLCTLGIGCVMQRGSRIENASISRSFRMGSEFLTETLLSETAHEAVEKTDFLFQAITPQGGEMPVVLGAGSSGILLHEAIGHAFEADFNRKNISVFSSQMGKKICSSKITVVDDGTLFAGRGSINFDDEGIASQKTCIVSNGKLESYLHDRISAKYYGVKPTGNGRRQSFRAMPLPRMRTTYLEAGDCSQQEMIATVKKGIFVDNFSNGQVQIGAGDFTFFVKAGTLIENGKLTQPVKDINIIGNGPKALADIVLVGNDLKIDTGAWTCGKDGQMACVSQGMPSALVKKLTVGGL